MLFERYKAINGAADKGLVILSCELIDNNGKEPVSYTHLDVYKRQAQGRHTGIIPAVHDAHLHQLAQIALAVSYTHLAAG